MCLIIYVNQEHFKSAKRRVDAKYRRRYPRLMKWLFGPQAPPPQYGKELSHQIKSVNIRPDSLLLPKYGGLRKDLKDQILVDEDGSHKMLGQDKPMQD